MKNHMQPESVISPASSEGPSRANSRSQLDKFGIKDNRLEHTMLKEEFEKVNQSSRSVIQRKEFSDAIGQGNHSNLTGMPNKLKTGIENLSGYSMDDVKVHYNSNKPANLNAAAYAQGKDIHVAPGEEMHLPHEAWHVVQQKQGRVKSTIQTKNGLNVNDHPGLEKEADAIYLCLFCPYTTIAIRDIYDETRCAKKTRYFSASASASVQWWNGCN